MHQLRKPIYWRMFQRTILNAIPPKQHDGRTQAGTSSHMCTVPSPPLPHLLQRPRDTRWQPRLDGYKSQGGLGQEYKVSLEQKCEELGLEPEFFQQPSDEALAFLALSSCLKHMVPPPHFQSMGGAGLSGAQRVHSRKAAAKALQELAPLRKPSPPESSLTPCTP